MPAKIDQLRAVEIRHSDGEVAPKGEVYRKHGVLWWQRPNGSVDRFTRDDDLETIRTWIARRCNAPRELVHFVAAPAPSEVRTVPMGVGRPLDAREVATLRRLARNAIAAYDKWHCFDPRPSEAIEALRTSLDHLDACERGLTPGKP